MKELYYAVPAELKKANPDLDFNQIDGTEFRPFGRLLFINSETVVDLADRITTINSSSNTYVAMEPELQKNSITDEFSLVFGNCPIEVGYCNGPNQYLNSMEYHKSPELFVAVTDCIQFITEFSYLHDFSSVDTCHSKAFFFPKGSVSILNSGVLHFSPCSVYEKGFKSLIVLPAGTNELLTPEQTAFRDRNGDSEAKLLFAQNKWLITHKDNQRMVDRGAFIGVHGTNLHISPIKEISARI